MMRKLTLFLLLGFAISASTNAQNLTIAKALYKKAQKEFSLKNYEKTLLILNKVKENLGGESNPEITFLEAKAHYSNDITVNTAKQLFLNFLEAADPSDSRVDEVSEIIADIEISDNIDEYGQFKDITGRTGVKKKYSDEGAVTASYTYKKGIQEGIQKNFYDTGELEWLQELANGKKHGFIKRYYKDGALKQSGNQVNGYINGEYKWYHNNGKLNYSSYFDEYGRKSGEEKRYNDKGILTGVYNYKNNKLNGSFTYYNDNGIITSSGFYKKGKWNGVRKRYFYNSDKIYSETTYSCEPCYDEKKPSIQEGKTTFYHKNGVISGEYNFVKGKNSGTQKEYHDNGNLKRSYYFNYNNKESGESKKYYKSGKLAINIHYENGSPIKLIEQLDSNGKKAKVSSLKKGNGVIKELFDDNSIKLIFPYANGKLHGNVIYYYNTGTISDSFVYENGKKTKGTRYFKSGQLNQEMEYKNGVSTKTNYYDEKTGTLKKISEYDDNGEPLITTYYNKKGKKTSTYNSKTLKSTKY